MKSINIQDPKYYVNRELSWLEFNQRVLEEVQDTNNPLLERLKFLNIVSSNLDEFFMIRVAFLKRLAYRKITKTDIAGLSPKQQLNAISKHAHQMVQEKYSLWNQKLLPELERKNISFITDNNLNQTESDFLSHYFNKFVYPVLTPFAVDSSRPFPLILNRTLNHAVLISNKKRKEANFASVQIPSVLPRIVELPTKNKKAMRKFIFLEDIVKRYLYRIFYRKEILCSGNYRITRDSDLVYQEEEANNLLREIEKSVKRRKWGQAIRLEITRDTDDNLVKFLKESLQIHKGEIYPMDGPIDLTFLPDLIKKINRSDLLYKPFTSKIPNSFYKNWDIFKIISDQDVLLFHPYDSFDPVIELIEKAANDPKVLAIKQTLYRVSNNSPIIDHLATAAEKGKQVTVVVELKARFDESQNINWARHLEEAGCHVIYGLVGLKIHAKMALIIRREKDEIKRYLHLSTGNYNDITAQIYSDIGLITCDESLGADASALFNMLSGFSTPPDLFKMDFAPNTMLGRFEQLIDNEIENAKQGKDARIIAKMNSLVDKSIISKFYQASQSGVKIDLIVRGICCLRPGMPGISDNISVRSIVGRFLEHSRIYYFYAGGREKFFLSSADLMPRNLYKRVELLFPVEDRITRSRLLKILDINFRDNLKSRMMKPDGNYVFIHKQKGEKPIEMHDWLIKNWDKGLEISNYRLKH